MGRRELEKLSKKRLIEEVIRLKYLMGSKRALASKWNIRCRQMKADLLLIKRQLDNISKNIQTTQKKSSVRYYPGGKISKKVIE
jgi:hypothetical protein